MNKKILSAVLSHILIFVPALAQASNYNAYKAYIKGVLELKAGLFEDAKKDYEKAASMDLNALTVYKDLVYLYWRLGNKEQAFQTAAKIDELDGQNPNTSIFLATFYLVANDSAAAKKYWEKTLELDADNETATVYLAAYYYSDNKLNESALYWNKFLQQQPDSSSGYFQLGMVQEKLSMFDEALKSYDKVIELKPEAREAYIAKARIYESMKRFDLAVKEYEEYASVFPDNFYVLMYLGKCYYENKEYAKAKDAFLRAKKGVPQDLTVIYWLGVSYEKLGDINRAAEEFEELVLKEPSVSVTARLGYYYSLLKEFKKSEKILLKALETEPANYEILYLIALNYMDWKKYSKAVEYLNKMTEISPDFADAYFFKASAYDKNGDFENAEKALLRALEINPEHARALNYLGYSYADRNIKLAEAEDLLTKAVNLDPGNGAYIDSLGWLYFRQGKFDLAERTLLASANMTGDPLMYDHLGDAYVELGRVSEAWTAYCLSYDIKNDKNVKKKLDMAQKQIPEQELYDKMLLRSESNYRKMPSAKSGYKAKISSGLFSANAYVPFVYDKQEGVILELPAKFSIGKSFVRIKDGKTYFEPKALAQNVPQELNEILDFAAWVLSPDFYSSFSGIYAQAEGGSIVYLAADGSKLVLNSDTALIEEISRGSITARIKKYGEFFVFKMPSKIKLKSKEPKFKVNFTAGKFTLFQQKSERKNENADNSESSGKN
ncbi:MAG: tetratricopeptide repeat protein [Endomicrobium sp.]|jgi:tetratricopeptide (TPR) repeat protein|nr:tetratricopeptide repeat protein [Endomicrobium sp.]